MKRARKKVRDTDRQTRYEEKGQLFAGPGGTTRDKLE